MARQGVVFEQVSDAAAVLLAEGQSVTVSSVREKIGSGSYSTINAHLSKWREQNVGAKPTDLPDMPDSVGNALRQVWALAWKEAQASMQAEREALEAARRDMVREKHDINAEIARLEGQGVAQADEIKKLSQTLDAKETALNEANTGLHDLRIDNARLDEKAKAAESRAGELKEELARLHESLKEVVGKSKTTESRSPKKID